MTTMQTMPAAVFAGEGRLDITERAHPELLAPDDVVLAVEMCGICGTDLKILERPQAHPATPGVILGTRSSASWSRPGLMPAWTAVTVSSWPRTSGAACACTAVASCPTSAPR